MTKMLSDQFAAAETQGHRVIYMSACIFITYLIFSDLWAEFYSRKGLVPIRIANNAFSFMKLKLQRNSH